MVLETEKVRVYLAGRLDKCIIIQQSMIYDDCFNRPRLMSRDELLNCLITF